MRNWMKFSLFNKWEIGCVARANARVHRWARAQFKMVCEPIIIIRKISEDENYLEQDRPSYRRPFYVHWSKYRMSYPDSTVTPRPANHTCENRWRARSIDRPLHRYDPWSSTLLRSFDRLMKRHSTQAPVKQSGDEIDEKHRIIIQFKNKEFSPQHYSNNPFI